jgi:proteasome lid subunit RPN8/RPN11
MSGEFEIVNRENGLPVRDRRLFERSVVFTDSGRSAAVLVVPDVARNLRQAASAARPTEVGGLLVGRRFRDEQGAYAVTLAYAQAPLNDGTPTSITLSPERTAELRQQVDRAYPSMDIIGWWHSHNAPSEFSSIDFQSQVLWSNPLHVGLLVFASGTPWAKSYLGPAAIPLRIVGESSDPDADALHKAGISGTKSPAASPNPPSQPVSRWAIQRPGLWQRILGRRHGKTAEPRRPMATHPGDSGSRTAIVAMYVVLLLLALSVLVLSLTVRYFSAGY